MPGMERFFNTAGPTIAADHYHLDPLQRLDWNEIEHLIATKRYFVLHAPRQTGKTTTLLAMMKVLNEGGRYACAYANIEGAQAARGDETQGIPASEQRAQFSPASMRRRMPSPFCKACS